MWGCFTELQRRIFSSLNARQEALVAEFVSLAVAVFATSAQGDFQQWEDGKRFQLQCPVWMPTCL